MEVKVLLIFTLTLVSVQANLEGPFLFFGPKCLAQYKRPALKFLNQDDLIKIYEEQPAIVVFNNQDSLPLSSGNFPRLRKMLEGLTMLLLPQDFLDVHPDYVSNETQVLTLQGPWSERDAQMTETFARLEDIYGAGRVLGILGNSVSQRNNLDYLEDSWPRAKREASTEASTDSTPQEDEKAARVPPKNALYNATSPTGKGVLLYSSGYPVLQYINGSTVVFNNPIGDPTIKTTRLYTTMVVKFADGDSKDKVNLEFSFKQLSGWWSAVGVEVKFSNAEALNLMAPPANEAPSAVLGRSYKCSLPLVYSSENATLTFPDVMMQPYMDNTEQFDDYFHCIGFMSIPIWSGLLVTSLVLGGLFISLIMIMDIKTMDKFETNKAKALTITVSE